MEQVRSTDSCTISALSFFAFSTFWRLNSRVVI